MPPLKNKEYFHSLTSLRGIAALWVAIGHISWTLPASTLVMFLPIVRKGYLAVDFFFILSGFVLAHAYKIHALDNFGGYARFCRARLARIFPIHIFVLLVFAAVYFIFLARGVILPGVYGAQALVAEFFLVHTTPLFDQSYFFAWNYPAWTLVVELWWFLLLAGLIVAFNKYLRPLAARISWLGKRSAFLLLAVGLLFILVTILLTSKSSAFIDTPNFYNSIVRSGLEFLAGLFLYKAFALKEFSLGKFGRYLLYAGLLAGIFIWFLPWPLYMPIAFWLMLLPFIVMAALDKETALYRILIHPALIHLGNISYSVYLIHGPIERVIAALWPKMAQTPSQIIAMYLIFISSALLLSSLSFKYIEKPFIAYFKRNRS